MLFFAKHGGQLCNRLWALYPAYTFAKSRRKKLHVLFADPEYMSLFPNACRDRCFRFWFTRKVWHKVRFMNWVISHLEKHEIQGELRECEKSAVIQHINGWEHRGDVSYCDKLSFKDSFVDAFGFSKAVIERVSNVMGDYDGKTIGIHARRGDYRQWKEGRYCYEDSVWARIMHSLQNQIEASGFKCRFLICSNEPWNLCDDTLDMFQIPGANGITDLCALSQCDYIIGPPSTYSQWASFVGNVPLHFILSSDEDIDVSDFSPVVRQDVFANGKCLRWDEMGGCFQVE